MARGRKFTKYVVWHRCCIKGAILLVVGTEFRHLSSWGETAELALEITFWDLVSLVSPMPVLWHRSLSVHYSSESVRNAVGPWTDLSKELNLPTEWRVWFLGNPNAIKWHSLMNRDSWVSWAANPVLLLLWALKDWSVIKQQHLNSSIHEPKEGKLRSDCPHCRLYLTIMESVYF